MKAIEAKNLTAGYEKDPILKDITLSVEEGEFVGIVGPNGSGKSTLLRALTKVIAPQAGEAFLFEKDLSFMKLPEVARTCAFVPQETLITFAYTVDEIVAMGRTPYLGRFSSEGDSDREIITESLKLTDSLHLKGRLINELSAGERQRVIISKALAQKPRILFLDEPTSHLDIGHQIRIAKLLKRLNHDKKLTIVCVFHDLQLASDCCGKLLLINEGRVVNTGSPQEVLTREAIRQIYKVDVQIGGGAV